MLYKFMDFGTLTLVIKFKLSHVLGKYFNNKCSLLLFVLF